ncbi:gamma carbonic anhydrase family protein [Helicobacter sp. 12S02634-8]|uniref:gamma carbonic anhydrase family protein n=1 Tax=Helicobacter sp. 12S02634-8 TaxID=1476199 RepID=UPI000BA60EA2|nr:gamma carbonic anhydrase family protein [Helicobacter sp. 12S02634-8]PAF46635.1 gamma carbonic anhydrase family protein [Helicobacter sp. 12S02634-8]
MSEHSITYNHIQPQIDPLAKIFAHVCVIGDVRIEEDCSVWFGCVLRGDVNHIHIGARSNIQDLSVVHVAHGDGGGVVIGSDVTIGHRCIIHACHIDSLCLVGMGSIVMDGARIGEMSIIGAGSLITKGKVFPPRSLIMGNPAKVVRELSEEEIASIKLSASSYVALAKSYMVSRTLDV